jgi:hypothetical protein
MIDALNSGQRERFVSWLRVDRRSLSAEEAAWVAFRRLSAAGRDEIRDALLG